MRHTGSARRPPTRRDGPPLVARARAGDEAHHREDVEVGGRGLLPCGFRSRSESSERTEFKRRFLSNRSVPNSRPITGTIATETSRRQPSSSTLRRQRTTPPSPSLTTPLRNTGGNRCCSSGQSSPLSLSLSLRFSPNFVLVAASEPISPRPTPPRSSPSLTPSFRKQTRLSRSSSSPLLAPYPQKSVP